MDFYSKIRQQHEEMNKRKSGEKLFASVRDVTLLEIPERGHTGTLLVSPEIGFAIRGLRAHLNEIPPNGKTGTHRHTAEALIYIVEGRGYSMVGERKVEWSAGDILCIPGLEWHRHENLDPEKRCRFLAITNGPLMESLGIARIEHQESSKE